MRMDNINQNTLKAFNEANADLANKFLPASTPNYDGSNLPEHISAFTTAKTIPSYFTSGDCIPPKLAIPTAVDQTPVDRPVNAGYER